METNLSDVQMVRKLVQASGLSVDALNQASKEVLKDFVNSRFLVELKKNDEAPASKIYEIIKKHCFQWYDICRDFNRVMKIRGLSFAMDLHAFGELIIQAVPDFIEIISIYGTAEELSEAGMNVTVVEMPMPE